MKITGIKRRKNSDSPERDGDDIKQNHLERDFLRESEVRHIRGSGDTDDILDLQNAALEKAVQDEARNRSMHLEMLNSAAEKPLKRRDQTSADDTGGRSGKEKPSKIGGHINDRTASEIVFDAFGEEWSLKRVRSARDKDQQIENSKRDRDTPGSDAGDTRGIGQSSDQMNDEREQNDDGQLSIHWRWRLKLGLL